jgi:hypothetical protein
MLQSSSWWNIRVHEYLQNFVEMKSREFCQAWANLGFVYTYEPKSVLLCKVLSHRTNASRAKNLKRIICKYSHLNTFKSVHACYYSLMYVFICYGVYLFVLVCICLVWYVFIRFCMYLFVFVCIYLFLYVFIPPASKASREVANFN